MKTVKELLSDARAALPALSESSERKNEALLKAADRLVMEQEHILEENAKDVEDAREKYGDVMIDRLMLSASRIEAMADGIRAVVSLGDPEGVILSEEVRPNGLVIDKVTVPLGVIAIIYESRPNVTSDAAALALKSGNAVVLRGGREALRSNKAIAEAMQKGLIEAGLPGELIGFVEDTDHKSAEELMTASGLVDLLIPRGGAGLIRRCVDTAKVPVIETGTGICHIYVEESADQEEALKIIENAKCSRPSVCNAEEVLLVDESIAAEFLPKLCKTLTTDRIARGETPVELRLDEKAQLIIPGTPASPQDFDTEFLDYILAVKTVNGIDEAISHIAGHSTGHSEAILTNNDAKAERFTSLVDSAAVYVNCSTRFTDGGEFGLGCEMGISTQKLHARGPMGLKELVTYKYIIHGSGQIR